MCDTINYAVYYYGKEIHMKKKKNGIKKEKPEEIEFLTLDDQQISNANKNKKKNKKISVNRKKKIMVFITITLALFLFLVYLFIIQKSLVRSEIENLEQLAQVNQMNYTALNKKLNTYVSIGTYRKIEKSFKKYLSDVVNAAQKIDELTNKEKLSNVLSADNIKNDGPKFEKTEEYLEKTIEEIKINFTNLIELMSEKKIMSYVYDKKLPQRYINFYEEVAIDENEDLGTMRKSLENSLEYYINVFHVFDKAIAYLKSHKSWKIENNKLVFHSSNEFQEYNKIVDKIK